MDELTNILRPGRPAQDIITDLKVKSVDVPEWDELLQAYEPARHRIVDDHAARRDKVRKDGNIERAARIHFGLEKLLVKRMTEFMFAIPVKRIYHNTEGNDTRRQIARALAAIYKYARIDVENIARGRAYFAACEMATVWYTVEKPNTLYGFPSRYKLKCKTYSPMDGVRLYPLLDERGDMLAMSFQYRRKVKDQTVAFFETYTAGRHYQWKQAGSGWQEVAAEGLEGISKIPCIYACSHESIYGGLIHLREEIEYTLSRNSDVVAYNSAPVLKVSGNLVQGGEEKGESRRVWRVENGGDVSYVSWTQGIEALKYHVDTMLKLYWMQAQMPDISFDNMKSLGNVGYDARQMLLTDAHLRVGDEAGAWIEFFEREGSVIKEILKMMKPEWAGEIDNVEIEYIITPFIQNDEDATADRLLKLNGGKAVMSQIESIQQAGYSNNPQQTLEQIRQEEAAASQARVQSLLGESAD